MTKRVFDYSCALVLLLSLAPLILAVAVLIRVSIGTPVLFRQMRPGLAGRPFELLKFRTMTSATDASGNLLSDAARLTTIGRYIRRASLDELPQLINVLRGEMSLVGPRPLLMEYLPLFSPEQARRHEVHPGITGWAQVNGRNAISWEEKLALDTWYVDHRTFMLDVGILLLTVKKVFLRGGISFASDATMPRFVGSSNTKPR